MRKRRHLQPTTILWRHKGKLPPGSDSRVRGGIVGRCVLCGKRVTLRLSHVLPKWAHRWHKHAEKGKVRGVYLSLGLQTEEQDGTKHYLLCHACEQFAAESEDYVHEVVTDKWSQRFPDRIKPKSEGSIYVGLDVQLLTRFVCITALRCHYAPGAPFHNFCLPLLLRKLLRKKIYGKLGISDLPWVGVARFVPPKENAQDDPKNDIIVHFEENPMLGPIFVGLIGGWEWYLFFNSGDLATSLSLRSHVENTIYSAPYSEHRMRTRMHEIASYAKNMIRANKRENYLP